MAPRGSKRKPADEMAVAKATAKKAAKAAEVLKGVAEATSASTLAINATLQAFLSNCDATIKDFFKDSLDGQPSSASGLAEYDGVVATRLLAAGKPYTCSAPLFWLNASYELQPNVPKYRKRLDGLKDHFFSEPTPFKDTIHVSLNPGEVPRKCKGALKAVSLPEMHDALRIAVAECIEDPTVPRKTKMAWKDVLMSIPFTFEACFFLNMFEVENK